MSVQTLKARLASLAVLVLLAGAVPAAEPARPDNLDEALRKAAPKIVEYLQGKKYENVGVLKFLVQLGKGELRDNVGPLNQRLADRLEVALVLALPEDTSLGLITRASEAVSQSGNRRATHRTASGRREFFPPRIEAANFKRAWGDGKPVEPDAFLTGEARFSEDMKTLEVEVQAFGKDTYRTLETVVKFTTASDFRSLGEAGMTLAVARGGLDKLDAGVPLDKSTVMAQPSGMPGAGIQQAKFVQQMKGIAPIRWQVFYSGKEVPLQGTSVPPPQKDDEVVFRLTNEGRETFGVVLKVNGRNTLFSEELPDPQCFKYILGPGEAVTIFGFQKDDRTYNRFEVLTPEESKGMAVNYGDYAGLFSLTVFRGAGAEDEQMVKAEASRPVETVAIARGTVTFKGGAPLDLRSLKADLASDTRKLTQEGSRGLIVKGEEGKTEIERVTFKAYPEPVLTHNVRYYQAQ